jgi:paired amphipathic helix protein Sin3a
MFFYFKRVNLCGRYATSHNDLLEEFTYFLPDSTTPAAGKKAGAGKGFRGKGGQLPGQAGGAQKRKGKGDKNAAAAAAAAAEVPVEPKEEERKTAACLAKELAFFEKVKARLHNREAYNELIKAGLYTWNPVHPERLKAPGFNP